MDNFKILPYWNYGTPKPEQKVDCFQRNKNRTEGRILNKNSSKKTSTFLKSQVEGQRNWEQMRKTK